MDKMYLCIDLKSFYASVECIERGLDPLKTNLVVADEKRTEKTICLAVSPSLKAYGVSGRARLFEVVERVREVNNERLKKTPDHKFSGKSYLAPELETLRAAIPAGYLEQDEDVLSYALFEQVALKFFEYRKNQKYGVDGNADAAAGVHTV